MRPGNFRGTPVCSKILHSSTTKIFFPIKNLNIGLVCLPHSILACVFPDMIISSNRHKKLLLFCHPNNDFQLHGPTAQK
jgi:hypothetical protein